MSLESSLTRLDHLNICTTDDPFDLNPLAERIRACSNFRFAWQFFATSGYDLFAKTSARAILDAIVDREDLHAFLRSSMDAIYPREFTIKRLHPHCSLNLDNDVFVDTLARAANDRLGAYSRSLHESSAAERQPIDALFSKLGKYNALHTVPGKSPDCETCQHHNSDLISSWFFDIAWDYTLLVIWPERQIVWLGCLTDTD